VIRLKITGQEHSVDVDDDMPLLWVLRDTLGLTGTKFGCGIGQCGACTVHVDGQATRSCVTLASGVGDSKVVTIEGLQAHADHPVQLAWIDHEVPQCGYCQPGMMMAAAALLKSNPHPTDADIADQITNICRCGTYVRIKQAIHAAADKAKAHA
jgi:isoquinoline 1-oxidoreductase alpha subunit